MSNLHDPRHANDGRASFRACFCFLFDEQDAGFEIYVGMFSSKEDAETYAQYHKLEAIEWHVTSGEVMVVINDERIRLEPGDVRLFELEDVPEASFPSKSPGLCVEVALDMFARELDESGGWSYHAYGAIDASRDAHTLKETTTIPHGKGQTR